MGITELTSVTAAKILVTELVGLGVRRFVLSPGSRSAPLAYALAGAEQAGEIELAVRLDERGAAFFALGWAKAAGQPVAMVCTSGTAVANYHPAVLEADLSRVPVIVLTADRPAELRGVLASQTIDQVQIFGSAVRGFQDLSPAATASEIEDAAQWAVELATAPNHPGPVHLNLQYQEPLAPTTQSPMVSRRGFASPQPTATSVLPSVEERCHRVSKPSGAQLLRFPPQTVVIAGDNAGPIAREVAEANGWPLLAEPSSGALGSPNQIGAYRYVLPVLAGGEYPDTVPTHAIVFGRPTLNRAVIKFLSNPNLHVTVVTKGAPPWPDAWLNTKEFLPESIVPLPSQGARSCICAALVQDDGGGAALVQDDGWGAALVRGDRGGAALGPDLGAPGETDPAAFLRAWLQAGQAAAEVMKIFNSARAVTADGDLASSRFGPLALARMVWEAQRESDTLVVGASNPIRDLDLLLGTMRDSQRLEGVKVFANRGVAGIDGTIATALGIAAANQASRGASELPSSGRLGSGSPEPRPAKPPVNRLLLGDLAFLHDVSSLLMGYGEHRPQLQIVVANDDGGSIFSGLEHGAWAASGNIDSQVNPAQRADTLKRVFTTPQFAKLERLCAGFGVPFTQVSSIAELKSALEAPRPEVEVVEVKLNGAGRRALHLELEQVIGQAIASAYENRKGNDDG